MLGSNQNIMDIHQELVNGATRIQRFVKRFSLTPDDEADCIQESIVRVLEQSRKNQVRNPVAYAMSVAKNIVFKKNIESDIKTVCEEDRLAPSLEDTLDYRQRIEHVNIALSRMPEMRRTVLIRRRFYGESRRQISEVLGISEEAVKKHITRAMADLQRYMDGLQ
jgi:RNA polymerase sigma factor (sigma-70 family)